jgi:hypothetical protein
MSTEALLLKRLVAAQAAQSELLTVFFSTLMKSEGLSEDVVVGMFVAARQRLTKLPAPEHARETAIDALNAMERGLFGTLKSRN